MADYNWALSQLYQGKKVHRKAWNPFIYLVMRDAQIIMSISIPCERGITWTNQDIDMQGDHWELFIEPIKRQEFTFSQMVAMVREGKVMQPSTQWGSYYRVMFGRYLYNNNFPTEAIVSGFDPCDYCPIILDNDTMDRMYVIFDKMVADLIYALQQGRPEAKWYQDTHEKYVPR